jgi:lipoprotein NlpD
MRVFVGVLFILLAACSSNPPAPVIDRTPGAKPKPPVTARPISMNTDADKDWRPDSHIVQKGDTLFGLGLEYGIDYKEIAAANNIAPPYPIKIGQKLDLTSFKTKPTAVAASNSVAGEKAAGQNEDGVVITPINTEPVVVGNTSTPTTSTGADKPIVSAVTPILSEPKAIREPYSLEAMNRVTNPTSNQAKTASTVATKPAETKPADSNTTSPTATGDESIAWAWPTQGKISASFNEATNKGIDIAGQTGQAINAASAGKVIYSGSDLRGYGKLVIVKHNKTYLSVYAHNSKIVVKEGQSVVIGQKIAEMGNTDSNTTKLHFEIRRLGKSVDPAKYLN